MKRSITVLIVLALSISLISAQCPNYTNEDKTCTDSCVPPLIPYETNKLCVSVAKCPGYFDKQALKCVDACPENFKGVQKDQTSPKVCVPCFFTDAQGNCFGQCPQPLISDTITKTCIENISDCTGYFIKEKSVCVAACPFAMVAQTVQNQKICVPCDVVNQCASVDINTCKQNLSSDKKACDKHCPPLEIPLSAVQGQNYIQCQKCAADKKVLSNDGKTCLTACADKQLIDKKGMRCMDPLQCDQFVVLGDDGLSYCVPQCPPNQAPVAVPGQAYQQCAACDSGKVFDPITKTCSAQCAITGMDANQKPICLRTVYECKGFINLALTQCVKQCEVGQLARPSELPGQFFCVAACDANEFKVTNPQMNMDMCLKTCPPDHFADTTKKTCTKIAECTANISIEGRQCLEKCPPGQIPDATTKKCKICTGKIQADGKTCGTACAATELFDIDLGQCVTSDKCAGKITNTTDKICSTKCRPEELLQTVNNVKTCLPPSKCVSKFVSSDGRQCVDACGANEITVTDTKNNNAKICILCPLGIAADGVSCSTGCTNFFDADQKKCVDTCSKYKSVDNKVCSTKCIPPQVNKSGNTTQCFEKCDAGQVFSRATGCIDQASCTDFISSNGAACIAKCADVMEAEPTDGTKNCVRCGDTQVPILSGSGASTKVQCSDKSSSNTDAKLRAQSLGDTLKNINQLGQDQKQNLRDQIKQLGSEVESGIKDAKTSATLSKDDQRLQIKTLIDNLRDIAKQFTQKIPNDDAQASSDDTENKLTLLSSEYNFISEKKKFGHAFKTSFNADDFKSTLSAPDLQVDVTSNQDSTAAKNFITTIDSLQVTNLNTNPYCTNDAACGSTGLFTVESTSSARRILQAADAQTYQTTYSVTSDKISKTICVSYDANGIMSLATTTYDKTNNKITCTFTTNASLYYDSTCQYIDPTICSTPNNNKPFDETITTSAKIITSFLASLLLFLF